MSRRGHLGLVDAFVAAWGFVALGLMAPLRAETVLAVPTVPGSEVTIKVAMPTAQPPRFGFAPVKVTIENSAAQERSWQFQFLAGVRGQFPGPARFDRTITVPAGQTRDTWIYVPVAEPGTPGAPPFLSSNGTFAPPPQMASFPSRPGTNATITKTSTGTKIVRTQIRSGGGGGGILVTTEINLNETTGEMTTVTKSPVAGLRENRTSTVPPGSDVTFTISPVTGDVGRMVTPTPPGAAMKVTVVTNPPGMPSVITLPAGRGTLSATAAPQRLTPSRLFPSGYSGPPMVLSYDVYGPGVVATTGPAFSALGGSANMRPMAATMAIERVLRESLNNEGLATPNLAPVDPAQLPADWRLWSAFAYVVMPADEFAGLDAARRAALRGWVAMGGQLILAPGEAGAKSTERIGAGSIMTLASPLTKPPTATEWNELGLSLGGTAGHPDEDSLMIRATTVLGEAVRETEGGTTWLMTFLVLFAIVVGPVNLFVFAPAARRHRLFFTTPLISLGAAILLGVTIFVQDGIGGDGRRRMLVVLVPGDNQAAVFQEQASRTGFLPGQSFALPNDTQFTVLPLEETSLGRIGNFSGANFTRDDTQAGGGWFGSRARQAHLLQRLVPTRGRVEQVGTGSNGAPIVQSSLASALQDFVTADERGNLWSTRELVPGRKVTLERGGTWIGSFPLGGTKRFSQLFGLATPVTAGQWGGRSRANDLAPIPTHKSVRWQESDVVYTGMLEGRALVAREEKP